MGIGVAARPRTHETEPSDSALHSLSELSVVPTSEVRAARLLEEVLGRVVLCNQQSCAPVNVIGEMLEPSIRQTLQLWRDSLSERFSLIADDLPLEDETARQYFEEGNVVGQIVSLWEHIRDIENGLPDSSDPTGQALLASRVEALQKLLVLISPRDSKFSTSDAPLGIGPVLEEESQRIGDALILSSRSPLSGAVPSPLVNSYLHELVEGAERILANPDSPHEMRISRSRIDAVRREAAECLRESERDLRCLAGLVAARFIGDVTISAEVGGQKVSSPQRCLALEAARIDRDRFASSAEEMARSPILSYQPKHESGEIRNEGVEEIRTRCKAPESLLNKLVDRMFGLHSSTPNDFSRYLKDVRGMSLIVSSEDEVRQVSRALHSLSFRDEELAQFGIEPSAATRSVVTFNTRDRLIGDSAWKGIKFVLAWNGSCTEVQIKTRDFFEKERQSDTREAHGSHKERQKRAREEFAERTGLAEVMSFYHALLEHTLIGSCEMPCPPASINLKIDE